jgi:hypothetical protein
VPILIHELPSSRTYLTGKDTLQGVLEYVISGTIDDLAVRNKVLSTAPAVYPTEPRLVRGDVQTRPLAGNLHYATVQYIPDYAPLYPSVGLAGPLLPPPAAPGLNTPLGADFAFDLTAQTEHVTQSKETKSKTGRIDFPTAGVNVVPPDNKRAIGITADGSVQGCDRFRPYLEWSTSKTFASITLEYIYSISKLIGTTNNAPFYGSAAGTQMFLGASGNTKDLNKCVVTFKFARAENQANIDILPDAKLRVALKNAWEYLWVAYKNVEDQRQITQQPIAAYVERIYDSEDFSKLGIG